MRIKWCKVVSVLLTIVMALLNVAPVLADTKSGDSTVYYESTIRPEEIGNYQFKVESHENPSHEWLPIVDKDYFPRTISTFNTEVDNTAPSATYKANVVSKVDVIFAVGKLSQYDTLQNYIPTFTSKLNVAGNNVDAKVEQVKTQDISFGGDFDWQLSGGGDGTGPRVTYGEDSNGNWIFFDGYNRAGPRDGAYMPIDGKGKLKIEFNVDASSINSHPGGDFVFRFGGGLDGPDSGEYAEVWVSLSGSGYREKGGYSESLQTGTRFKLSVIASVQTGEVEVQVDGITVVTRSNVPLTANSLFLYFQHGGHACNLKSSTKISGIKMEVDSSKSLGEAIQDVAWRDGAARFIIHATDITPVEMESGKDAMYQYTVTKLLNSNVYLINLGNGVNKESLDKLLNALTTADGEKKGTFYQNYPITTALNNSANYILDIVRQYAKPTDWVLVNTEIAWETLYKDQEKDVPLNFGEHDGTKNSDKSDIKLASTLGVMLTHLYKDDKIYAEKWRYRHFNTVYDNAPIVESFSGVWLEDPITLFENPGLFRINYKRRDNPFHKNVELSNPFDSYRYWSTDYDFKVKGK